MINVQNISSKLASLPDQALRQYAEMHKEDPYVFSLALSESNRRKQLRMQTQQPEQQPKVVDKELADMDMRKALPEDLGIARIPVDMNMASGGIVAFGDGGDVDHYDKGGNIQSAGSDPKLAYRQYALAQANKVGLDPALVDTIFQIESGYDPEAQSPTGPQGIGQLTKATGKAYGVDPKERKDPYKNIDASIAYMADLNKKYAGDPSKIAVAYNQGEPVLNKHLRENQGELNVSTLPKEAKGYIKKLTDLLPISSANAAAAPSQPPVASQEADRSISGQLKDIGSGIAGIVAPEGAGGYAPGTRNFFERAADVVGVPENVQRNFSNTLNALPGASMLRAPVAVGKLSTAAQAAREAEIAAATAKAEAAAGKVANLRLPPPAASEQGIAAIPRSPTAPPVTPRQTFPLSPESVAMNEKMQAARQAQQLRNLEADKAAAEAASKGVTTAKNAAQTSEAMEMANAARTANMANKVISPANKTLATARNIQAARVGSDVNMPSPAADQQMPQSSLGPAVYETKKSPYTYQPEQYQPQTKTEEKQIIAAAKEALPKTEDTDGWSKNDWLQFGLAMMAGQSPNALTNIGAAGLAVLSNKAEKAKEQSKLDLYKSVHGEKPGQTIQIAERLMAADPKLSFEQALEKGAYLIGGAIKEENAATSAERASAAKLKDYQAAKAELYKTFQPYMTGTGPTAKAKQAEYQNLLKELQDAYKMPATTPVAPAAAAGWGQAMKQ